MSRAVPLALLVAAAFSQAYADDFQLPIDATVIGIKEQLKGKKSAIPQPPATESTDEFDALLAPLSNAQLLGQMLLIKLDKDIVAKHESYIKDGTLAGGLMRWDKFDAQGAKDFTDRLQRLAAQSPINRNGGQFPFLVTIDHEGGPLFTQRTYGATVFPGNMALGAAGDPALAERAAAISGRELHELGIQVTYGPVMDVNTNPDNPIIGVRSYCEDPASVTDFSLAALRGYLKGGVIPVAKHFPGHGSTGVGGDSHLTLPCVGKSCQELESCDLMPFRAGIKEGLVPMVMPGHLLVPALGDDVNSVTHSAKILDGFLRADMGFDGVIVSDSLDMAGAASPGGLTESIARAINAGNDLLLLGLPADYQKLLTDLSAQVSEHGPLTRQRLLISVKRILKLKKRIAAMTSSGGDEDGPTLAREIARRSITLLRNSNSILPLKLSQDRKLFVALFYGARFEAEAKGLIADISAWHANSEASQIPVEAKAEALSDVLAKAGTADIVIVGTYASGNDTAIQKDLVARLKAQGKTVVIASLMNPYDVAQFPDADAILCAYGMTPVSLGALVDVLSGRSWPPQGKLPVTIPSTSFARGSGLSN